MLQKWSQRLERGDSLVPPGIILGCSLELFPWYLLQQPLHQNRSTPVPAMGSVFRTYPDNLGLPTHCRWLPTLAYKVCAWNYPCCPSENREPTGLRHSDTRRLGSCAWHRAAQHRHSWSWCSKTCWNILWEATEHSRNVPMPWCFLARVLPSGLLAAGTGSAMSLHGEEGWGCPAMHIALFWHPLLLRSSGWDGSIMF